MYARGSFLLQAACHSLGRWLAHRPTPGLNMTMSYSGTSINGCSCGSSGSSSKNPHRKKAWASGTYRIALPRRASLSSRRSSIHRLAGHSAPTELAHTRSKANQQPWKARRMSMSKRVGVQSNSGWHCMGEASSFESLGRSQPLVEDPGVLRGLGHDEYEC